MFNSFRNSPNPLSCRLTFSLVVDTRVVVKHHRQGSSPVKLIVDTRVVAKHHRQGSTPVKLIRGGGGREKVSLNWLKFAKQVAYGQAIIATRGFCKCQNSYGFRAIQSWVTILADFQKRGIYKGIGFEAKLTFAVFFPINKRSPNFYFFTRLQGCKPLPLGKSSKKNEYVSKEKKAKNPQNLSFFQKNALNFAISKFSKVLKKKNCIRLKRYQRFVLEKNFKKNKNENKKIEPKNRLKLLRFQTSANRH